MSAPPLSAERPFLHDSGIVASLMREMDWSTSPLGEPEYWPEALKLTVALMLSSKFPMFAAWGPELGFVYNDAYAEILGSKHPAALGGRFHNIWAEIWPDIIPLIDAAMAGEAVYRQDLPLLMRRNGYDEQTWFTFSYSPLKTEKGEVGGMFCACVETTGQVLAERAIKESEARFRNMADHAPVMMWVTDPNGYCTYLNKKWYEFTGQTSDQAEGFGWLDATHPDDKPGAERVFREANEARIPFSFEYRLRRADGSYGWALDAAAPRFADDGTYLGYVGSVIDIDARRAGEERQRHSEATLRRFTNALPSFIWFATPDGKLNYFNDRWYEYTGLTAEQSLPDGWTQTLHPDDAQLTGKRWAEARARGTTYEVEMRYRRRDGTYRWYVARAEPIRDATGEITSWVGSSIDIHDRKIAEAALLRLNETLEEQVATRAAERDRLWNLSQDILARADYLGMISAASPAWKRLLGWTHEELLTRDYATFIHPEDVPATLASIAQMSETREPSRFENRIATSDGGWKPIEWTVAPEPDGKHFIAVGRDLSQTKAREAELEVAQEALRQSQKMEAMGSLTGGVAHDFNNLLTPIIASLDMLVRKAVGTERERRLIDGALQSAERAKILVQRLLAFARRQPLQSTAVDIAELVSNMAELIDSTVGPSINVRVELARSLPAAMADPNQLEMALLNLAVNSRDAMPDGGSLTIAARCENVPFLTPLAVKPGAYVKLTVSDNGAGMDETTRRRATEPFFSTKGIGKGTGLGLSMVHGLVAQLGGGLTIESEPGSGTTVSMWLPISTMPIETETLPVSETGAFARRGTALLVDDEALVRMSTADMLQDLGFEVQEVGSADEALRVLKAGTNPDLLVTDHLMPGMNGVELVGLARRLLPDLPVLIVSGYAEMEGIASDLPRLVKPFRIGELATCLSRLLPGLDQSDER